MLFCAEYVLLFDASLQTVFCTFHPSGKSKKCCGDEACPVEFLSSNGLQDLFGLSVPAGGFPTLQMRFDPC